MLDLLEARTNPGRPTQTSLQEVFGIVKGTTPPPPSPHPPLPPAQGSESQPFWWKGALMIGPEDKTGTGQARHNPIDLLLGGIARKVSHVNGLRPRKQSNYEVAARSSKYKTRCGHNPRNPRSCNDAFQVSSRFAEDMRARIAARQLPAASHPLVSGGFHNQDLRLSDEPTKESGSSFLSMGLPSNVPTGPFFKHPWRFQPKSLPGHAMFRLQPP